MSHGLVYILRKKQVQVDCKQSFIFIQMIHTYKFITFPKGALQRHYNKLLSTEKRTKINRLILTIAIRIITTRREKTYHRIYMY